MPSQLSLACPEPGQELFEQVEVRRGLPLRGFLFSIYLHAVLFGASYFIPWNYWLPKEAPAKMYELTMIRTDEPLLLPALQPAAPAAKEGAEGADGGHAGPRPTPVALPHVVHKGPQLIVSAPPNPDNELQTIRQPDMVKPPKFPVVLPAPNMVMIASHAAKPTLVAPRPEVKTPPTPDPPKPAVKPEIPVVRPTRENAPELARLRLPDAVPPPPPPKPAEIPLPPLSSITHADSGPDMRDLLVLNAEPAEGKTSVAVPPGELHGSFVVSPVPLVASAGAGPIGGVAGGQPEQGEIGGGNGIGKGSGAGTGAGNGTGHGSGPGAGTGNGTGTGSIGRGPGAGARGSGTGRPGGTGSQGGTGNGSGTGSGPGSPFPDVVVQGGTAHNGKASAASDGGVGTAGKYSYGMTIVSSASGGGGLKDFGVFRNETVYTVYVPMAESSSWTMQYAAMAVADGNQGSATPAAQRVLTAPYPLNKNAPQFAPELVARHSGRMIIVRAVITREGKLDAVRILQSPDVRLTDVVVAALDHCAFHPAELNGESIPVKVVIGIPVL